MTATRHWKCLFGLATSIMVPSISFAVEEGGEGGVKELPSFVNFISPEGSALVHWMSIIYAAVVSIILAAIAIVVYRRRKMIPGPLQNVVELAVESMYNFLHSVLGDEARRFVPFLGTLFFYILFMNLMGIIPGGYSPSTNINITASLAILVFIYVQYIGFTRMGVVRYFDHLLGQPRGLGWIAAPFVLISEFIGVFAKPFTLAIRLFGNLTGEDILVAGFVGLGVSALSFIHSPIGLPFQLPFYFLGILLSTIQALVFTLLSTIYILLMIPHTEHEGH
ncbi:MAG TPA: F0F1 ATP synthase subunit A [Candidatus Acidoferrum sp.]|nr:F0F1 ATP synthase subunit A [Candidatus Acidoferrum sp.]